MDPGITGAVALLDHRKHEVLIEDMPTVTMKISGRNRNRIVEPVLAAVLREWALTRDIFAVIEQVGAMPGQGVTSTFTFGMSFGICTGVLAGLNIPSETVRPQEWKKLVRVPRGKDASRAMAARLFPRQAALFARKRDDGRSDAVLLAIAAHKLHQQNKFVD